jgi:hypothetical protein
VSRHPGTRRVGRHPGTLRVVRRSRARRAVRCPGTRRVGRCPGTRRMGGCSRTRRVRRWLAIRRAIRRPGGRWMRRPTIWRRRGRFPRPPHRRHRRPAHCPRRRCRSHPSTRGIRPRAGRGTGRDIGWARGVRPEPAGPPLRVMRLPVPPIPRGPRPRARISRTGYRAMRHVPPPGRGMARPSRAGWPAGQPDTRRLGTRRLATRQPNTPRFPKPRCDAVPGVGAAAAAYSASPWRSP